VAGDEISQDEQAALDQMEALDRRRAEREGQALPTAEELERKRPHRLEAIRGNLQDDAQAAQKESGDLLRQQTYAEAKERLEAIQNKAPSEREDAELEQAIYEASVAWFRFKWGSEGLAPDCPYCGVREWAVDPPLSLLIESGSLLPMIPVVCTNCGHITFVTSVYAGLPLEGGEDDEEGK
jgi:hypothetical protein